MIFDTFHVGEKCSRYLKEKHRRKEKHRQNFSMYSRCVAPCDKKAIRDKQPEIGTKVGFGDAEELASVLVDQTG